MSDASPFIEQGPCARLSPWPLAPGPFCFHLANCRTRHLAGLEEAPGRRREEVGRWQLEWASLTPGGLLFGSLGPGSGLPRASHRLGQRSRAKLASPGGVILR